MLETTDGYKNTYEQHNQAPYNESVKGTVTSRRRRISREGVITSHTLPHNPYEKWEGKNDNNGTGENFVFMHPML